MVTKKEILDTIQRCAQANRNRLLGRVRFEGQTGISESDWAGRYWIRWSDAVREAGFEPNELQGPTGDQAILDALIDLIVRLGRFPVENELRMERRRDKQFPSHGAIHRLGKKAERAQLVIERCESRGDLANVVAICEPQRTGSSTS